MVTLGQQHSPLPRAPMGHPAPTWSQMRSHFFSLSYWRRSRALSGGRFMELWGQSGGVTLGDMGTAPPKEHPDPRYSLGPPKNQPQHSQGPF